MAADKDPNYKKAWSKTPRAKYAVHKAQARSRGIEFTLTFEEWWALWEPHWSERGRKPSQYCMTRKNDTGGYTCGNVVVKPVGDNISEQLVSGAHASRKLSFEDIREIRKLSGLLTDAEIGQRFGVSQPHVTRVLNGKRGHYVAKEAKLVQLTALSS